MLGVWLVNGGSSHPPLPIPVRGSEGRGPRSPPAHDDLAPTLPVRLWHSATVFPVLKRAAAPLAQVMVGLRGALEPDRLGCLNVVSPSVVQDLYRKVLRKGRATGEGERHREGHEVAEGVGGGASDGGRLVNAEHAASQPA